MAIAEHAVVILSGAAVALILILFGKVIYNIFLHPLRSYPGPLLHRASSVPWAIGQVSGRQARLILRLHDKYGPVVRISPRHLVYTDSRAWKDIYGHRVSEHGDTPELAKAEELYRAVPNVPTSILSAERVEHQQLRRALSHGFSDKSMREQEGMVMKYIDLLMQKLAVHGSSGNSLDMCKWFNFVTFDVISDLVFSEPFGCLETEKYHPFMELILGTIKQSSWLQVINYLGGRGFLKATSFFGDNAMINQIRNQIGKKLDVRMSLKEERADLFAGLLNRKEAWGFERGKLLSNPTLLIVAGSETTATLLSGVTFLLLTHPECLRQAQDEVRSAFTSDSDITLNAVGGLTYMLACLNEALRCYPPASSNLVRVVPEGGLVIAGQFVPGGTFVEVQQWSMNHATQNWTDRWAFRPERFLKGSAEQMEDDIGSLQPFHVGPRNCIGRNLAYAEMRLILARILFSFDMRLADECKDWMANQDAYGLWVRPPLHVYLTPVSRQAA